MAKEEEKNKQAFSLDVLSKLFGDSAELPFSYTSGSALLLHYLRRQENMDWKLAKMVRNREYKIDGINIFDLEWEKEGQVELKDVAHAMRRPFDICKVTLNEKTIRFAVCEIAQNVYCFYLPAN